MRRERREEGAMVSSQNHLRNFASKIAGTTHLRSANFGSEPRSGSGAHPRFSLRARLAIHYLSLGSLDLGKPPLFSYQLTLSEGKLSPHFNEREVLRKSCRCGICRRSFLKGTLETLSPKWRTWRRDVPFVSPLRGRKGSSWLGKEEEATIFRRRIVGYR